MAEMPTRASATKALMTCPACHKPITAHMAMDLHLGVVEPSMSAEQQATVDATVRLIGLTISHDCTPKVTRTAVADHFRPTTERTAP